MEVGVLGPLTISDGGRPPGAAKERALVEVLALRVPRPARQAELIDALWGDEPPPSAAKTLQSLVARVRRSLPAGTVVRVGDGYQLASARRDIDCHRFDDLVSAGRAALAQGDPAAAMDRLRTAAALWRGTPVADVAAGMGAAERVRLEESFRTAIEDLAAARLALGDDGGLVGELEAAVVAEPLRERRWAQLMLALYRAGRRGEALRAYQRARQVLGEGLGLEPGAELVELERAIARDDPTLRAAPPTRGVTEATGAPRPDAGARPSLPFWLTSFVGRSRERLVIATRLAEARLVTVTGPGGVGKTRLAAVVAADLQPASGLWFVDLTGVGDDHGVVPAIAATIDVGPDPGRSPLAALSAHCASLDAVIVLDNCEHVVDGVAAVARRLLAEAPSVRLLVTSREPLAVPGEVVVPVAPLLTPAVDATAEDMAHADAVRLFVDRAGAVVADFALDAATAAAVGAVCRRLDGLPLAIELAAAQVDVLTPAQIERRLADHALALRSPERGGSERHRTMDAVLDWSYGLLDEPDRIVFDRLAVFRGLTSLDAIETVVAGEGIECTSVLEVLARLVRRSLVVTGTIGAERRYRLLETIRDYAWGHLDRAGRLAVWRERHFDWALGLAAQAGPELAGGDQGTWLARIDADLDNLEEALGWSALDPARAERALPAVLGLFTYWLAGGTRRAQGVRWLRTLAEAAVTMDVGARVEALWTASLLVAFSDLRAGQELAAAAQQLAERADGDDRAVAAAAVAVAFCATLAGDAATARAFAGRRMDALEGQARLWGEFVVAWTHVLEGAPEQTYRGLEPVGQQLRAMGDTHLADGLLSSRADVGVVIGADPEQLRHDTRTALATALRIPCASCEAQALATLVLVDPCDDLGGRVEAARRSVALAHAIGETAGVLYGLTVLAGALGATGASGEAAFVAGGAQALAGRTGYGYMLPGRRQYLEAGLAAGRADLGDTAFAALFTAGERASYDDLIAVAVGDQPFAPVPSLTT